MIPTVSAGSCFDQAVDDNLVCRADSLVRTGEQGLFKSDRAHSTHPKQPQQNASLPSSDDVTPPGENDVIRGQDYNQLRAIKSYDGYSESQQRDQTGESSSKELRYMADRSRSTVSPLGYLSESIPSQPTGCSPLSHEDLPSTLHNHRSEGQLSEDAQGDGDNPASRTMAPHETKSFCKRHRRNHAALQISNTNIGPSVTNDMMGLDGEVPILSPEPISPLRQLRVRRSIPQLLKAVPGVPDTSDEEQYLAAEIRAKNSGEGEAQHLSPEETGFNAQFEVEPRARSNVQPSLISPKQSQGGLQKFRLKIRKSASQESRSSLGIPGETNSDSKHLSSMSGASPERKRLKVKANRNQKSSQKGAEICSPILPVSTPHSQSPLKDSIVANEVAPVAAMIPSASEHLAHTHRPFSASKSEHFTIRRDGSLNSNPPQRSVRGNGMRHRTSISIAGETRGMRDDAVGEKTSTSPHRIRQKMSMSRLFSHDKQRAKLSKRQESVTLSTSTGSRDNNSSSVTINASSPTTSSDRPVRRGGRFKRFTSKTKKMIRQWMRRRLHHPSPSSG